MPALCGGGQLEGPFLLGLGLSDGAESVRQFRAGQTLRRICPDRDPPEVRVYPLHRVGSFLGPIRDRELEALQRR